jgi:hypothetical protein
LQYSFRSSDKSARIRELAKRIDRGDFVTCRECNKIIASDHIERIGTDKKCVGTLCSDSAEGSVKFSSRAGIVHFELNAIGLRSYLHVSYFWDSVWAKGVRQHGDHGSLGNKFT